MSNVFNILVTANGFHLCEVGPISFANLINLTNLSNNSLPTKSPIYANYLRVALFNLVGAEVHPLI